MNEMIQYTFIIMANLLPKARVLSASLPFILKLHPCELHGLVSMETDTNIYDSAAQQPTETFYFH